MKLKMSTNVSNFYVTLDCIAFVVKIKLKRMQTGVGLCTPTSLYNCLASGWRLLCACAATTGRHENYKP